MEISTVKQIFRRIFTDSTKYDIVKQAKVMNKIMNKNKQKRESINDNINPYAHATSTSKLSIHTVRRMIVLNKVFMKYITDLMSTGEIVPEILNKNIEISHVKVTADFKFINVYWIDNNTENTDIVELLQKCASQLRHELSQLRVIGVVPPIKFVKCKGTSILREVEQKLKIMDFGEDHVSSPYPDAIQQIITASGTSDVNQNVENVENNNFSITLPVMRHDVFGLDHFRIMSQIKSSLNKSKKVTIRQIENMPSSNSYSTSNIKNSPNFVTNREEQNEFKQFLYHRRKEQRKKMKKYRVDNSIYDSEEQSDNDDLGNDYNDFTEDNYDENIDYYKKQ
ncbi:putative ribosome-binding factor A, mitochondrial [Bombus huntii]|uniref:putative ribosome-binding factor A, mitochondrial n=1 Tax=Bombus huntii TaxID=85661 RepID=UPI0021AA2BEC|nr:putative ribosome-binding factor A, mitochondrial [Bombus huntii]XP_050484969.1 putative ribosome-binding factor A, mitochondrial [Bombus huntii]XP_050484971.1 putative ribosome-binding factor A, mitochondrial [Bombus huntii]